MEITTIMLGVLEEEIAMFDRMATGLGCLLCVVAAPACGGEIPAWYPAACATTDQCGVVENIALTGEGAPHIVIGSRYGQANVTRSFQMLDAPDGRTHVCVRYDPFGELEVTCLMVPRRAS
jgi:hypothetical protein